MHTYVGTPRAAALTALPPSTSPHTAPSGAVDASAAALAGNDLGEIDWP